MEEKLKQAYELLSRIPVTGNSVDVLAAVRALLRDSYKEAQELGRQGDTGSPDN